MHAAIYPDNLRQAPANVGGVALTNFYVILQRQQEVQVNE